MCAGIAVFACERTGLNLGEEATRYCERYRDRLAIQDLRGQSHMLDLFVEAEVSSFRIAVDSEVRIL